MDIDDDEDDLSDSADKENWGELCQISKRSGLDVYLTSFGHHLTWHLLTRDLGMLTLQEMLCLFTAKETWGFSL